MSMYTNTHFISGFCNGNGSRAAVVEYQQFYPCRRTSETVCRNGGNWFLPTSKCFWGSCNSSVLQTFVDNELPPCLEDRPVATQVRMWLHHDRAPPDFGREVTKFLNENYKGRWIGRYGVLGWPAWSPNLYLLDSFLWRCMKLREYHRGKREG